MISNTSIPNSGNTVDDFPREYVYEEDDGMYVYDVKVRSKYSDATEVPAPEAKKPGHKRTDPGIYDDLYDYNLDAPIDDGSPDQTVLKKENVCLNHKKSLISCVLGIFLVGALTVGVVFSLQGKFCFLLCIDNTQIIFFIKKTGLTKFFCHSFIRTNL